MPQIESWSQLPQAIRDHLVERMHDRKISLDDLNQLRIWIDSRPDVPEGARYKDFGGFKICGEGKYPKTFLLAGQAAVGRKLQGLDPPDFFKVEALHQPAEPGSARTREDARPHIDEC